MTHIISILQYERYFGSVKSLAIMKRRKMIALKIIGIIIVIWTILTFIAEAESSIEKMTDFGGSNNELTALIVYDPDPFYNLDEQVSKGFAEGLAQYGWSATVTTVASANKIENQVFNLYVFCANTYNWSPDWAVTRYIKKHKQLEGKPVVAITLGSGSTNWAKKGLEKKLKKKNTNLLDSRVYWLMKPNSETLTTESNIKVAIKKANDFGLEIGKQMASAYNLSS